MILIGVKDLSIIMFSCSWGFHTVKRFEHLLVLSVQSRRIRVYFNPGAGQRPFLNRKLQITIFAWSHYSKTHFQLCIRLPSFQSTGILFPVVGGSNGYCVGLCVSLIALKFVFPTSTMQYEKKQTRTRMENPPGGNSSDKICPLCPGT